MLCSRPLLTIEICFSQEFWIKPKLTFHFLPTGRITMIILIGQVIAEGWNLYIWWFKDFGMVKKGLTNIGQHWSESLKRHEIVCMFPMIWYHVNSQPVRYRARTDGERNDLGTNTLFLSHHCLVREVAGWVRIVQTWKLNALLWAGKSSVRCT